MKPTHREIFLAKLAGEHEAFANEVTEDLFQTLAAFVVAAPAGFCAAMGESRMRGGCLEQVRGSVERAVKAFTAHLATAMAVNDSFASQYLTAHAGCIASMAEEAGVEPALIRFVHLYILRHEGGVPLIGDMMRGVLRPDTERIREWAEYAGVLRPRVPNEQPN